MKKVIALMLALIMVLSLAACGGNSSANNAANTNNAAPAKTPDDYDWPSGNIKVYIPGAAGSNTDLSARYLLDFLGAKYPNAKFEIINEKTGDGTMAMELTRNEKPDGSCIMFTGSGSNIMYHQGKYQYNVMDPTQFTIVAPAAGGNGQGSIFLTQPNAPYNNYKEFVQYCNDHPGEVKFATNTGTTQEMKVKLFLLKHDLMDKVKLVIASGNELVTGLLNGSINVGLQSENKAAQYIEAGQLKGLFNNTHMEEGMTESTKNIDTYYDLGLLDIAFRAPMYIIAPGNMDEALAQKICSVINEVEKDDATQQKWAKMNSWFYAKSLEQIRSEVKSTDEDCKAVVEGKITKSQFGTN